MKPVELRTTVPPLPCEQQAWQTQQQQRDAAQHHAAMLQPAEDVQASLSALEGLLGLDPKPALPGHA